MSNFLFSQLATAIKPGALPQPAADSPHLVTILNVAFNFIGAIALLVIVISGFRYITSGGESDKISKAKNGIVYALVGLAIAVSARAIVAFVATRIGS